MPLLIRRSLSQGSTPVAATALGLLLLAAGPLVSPSRGSEQLAGPSTSAAAPARESTLQSKPAVGYAITPRRRALLNTIRYAEGTWKQGQAGYRTLYGGGRFASLACHPEIVVVKRYTSAAAGAYQFLPGTWREAASKLKLERFDSNSQDQAALYLVDRRGVLADIDEKGLTHQAMAVLAREWASFPNLRGRSAYGQPVKKADELRRFYSSNLESLSDQA